MTGISAQLRQLFLLVSGAINVVPLLGTVRARRHVLIPVELGSPTLTLF